MRILQLTTLTMLVFTLALAGCESSSDNGESANANAQEVTDVTGTWLLASEPILLTFTQDGTSVQGTDTTGATFTGVVSGNQLSGTWIENDGDSTPMTVTVDGNTMTGSVVDSSDGEVPVTAVRQ